ncbi:MAG: hypothetical protein ABIZ80_26105 [Bryobacteraceae bacterium]
MTRAFRIAESKRFEFRSLYYNVFNNANLGSPAGAANAQGMLELARSSPTFGRITITASDARIIEFGMKFVF